MLNLKDNDVDDLFRRASDKYPLRTDSADWDRMAAALDNPPPELPYETPDTNRRRKRMLLLFFVLLPLAGIGYLVLRQTGTGNRPASAITQPASSSADSHSGGKAADAHGGANSADAHGEGNLATEGQAGGVTQPATGATGSTGETGSSNVNDVTKTNGVTKTNDATGANAKTSGGKTNEVANVTPTSGSRANVARINGSKTKIRGEKGRMAKSGHDKFSDVTATAGEKGGSRVSTSIADAPVPISRVAGFPIARAPTAGDYKLTVNVESRAVPGDSSGVMPKAVAKRKAALKQKEKFLYAGLLGSPDYSTVKFQSSKGVGTTFGVLLGYQFNKRWAVESGVYLDKKRYFTDAEYFDMKKIPAGAQPPPNWTLNNMDGTCYMWEIPINIRYNFSQGERSTWFATAGLSTYLMTRENYNYNYTWWNGTNSGENSKTWDWRNPSQSWFSIVNLSAGYETRLGVVGNLRIEPYLRVPLSGLGTGNLNILSMGVNIGITRRLW